MPRHRHHAMARRVNPISRNEELLLTGALLVAAAGGVYYYLSRYTLTLANGAMSLKVPVGTSFTLKLPSGGTWTAVASASGSSIGGSAPTGNAPLTYTSAAGLVLNATWMLNGAPQNTTITITQ
jgi:hypothetical protein